MPRIKIGQRKQSAANWQQAINERLLAGKVLPVISNTVGNDLVLGGHAKLIQAYANYIHYPLDHTSLSKMVQFKNVHDEIDAWAAKTDYVNFIKNRLVDMAEAADTPANVLEELEEEFDAITFFDFCVRLGYPQFDTGPLNPLLVLADFPLPIYVTTSYHHFIEIALKRAGKKPRTEFCRWHKGLESIPSVFDDEYQPSKDAPLVYHLHGVDEHPASLVLTEDDHLEFLIAISQDKGRNTDPIPLRIREAMADSSLMLLGFTLSDWEFRTLFWTLIRPRPIKPVSVCIQLTPSEAEQRYAQRYLDIAQFKVYWGDVHQYAQELCQVIEA